tara:strand:- start:6538 stop:7470 length:933 start_codon:yes stop_codon:yes gene_type:complete
MRFHEEHYSDYIDTLNNNNFHKKLSKITGNLPSNLDDLCNLIIYGPSGSGKYSQVLNIIKRYSNSNLKYEKRISIQAQKNDINIKISDIHYEIDMNILGCNSKTVWNEIFNQILNIINQSKINKGIIVCKNFETIHSELLDIFFSYMQNNSNIKYILITTNVSFIPDIILNKCEIINVPIIAKGLINSVVKGGSNKTCNIKYLKGDVTEIDNIELNRGNKILELIIDYKSIKYAELRDIIYNLLIYNIDINYIIWHIISTLIKDKYIKEYEIPDVLLKTYTFFQFYNNNYRPIYHLENYIYYLVIKVNEL